MLPLLEYALLVLNFVQERSRHSIHRLPRCNHVRKRVEPIFSPMSLHRCSSCNKRHACTEKALPQIAAETQENKPEGLFGVVRFGRTPRVFFFANRYPLLCFVDLDLEICLVWGVSWLKLIRSSVVHLLIAIVAIHVFAKDILHALVTVLGFVFFLVIPAIHHRMV